MDLPKKRQLDENNNILPPQLSTAAADIDLSLADARKILDPFTKDQLLDVLQSAIILHVDVLTAVRSIADRDPTHRKLFVHGLGWETTTDKLAAVFSAYGDLDEAVVIIDKVSNKSKGFGFVTFTHVDGAVRALKEPSKKIDGRITVANLAAAGAGPAGAAGGGTAMALGPAALSSPDVVGMRKIFVGNVPYEIAGERLLAHFMSYGEIEEGPLGFDKATGRSKGYALFVYETVEAARKALVDPIKMIDGVQMICKLANEGKRGKVWQPWVGGGVSGEGHSNGIAMQQQQHQQQTGVVGQYGGGFGGGVQGPSPRSQVPVNVGFSGPVVGGPGLSSIASQTPTYVAMGVGDGYGSGIDGGTYGGLQYGGPGSTGYGGLVGAASGRGGMGSGIGGVGSGIGGVGSGFGGTPMGLGTPASSYGGLGVGLSGAGSGIIGAASSLGGFTSGLGGVSAGVAGATTGLTVSGLGVPGRLSTLYGSQPNQVGLGLGGYSDSAHYSLSGGSGYHSQHPQMAGASLATRVPHSGMYPPEY